MDPKSTSAIVVFPLERNIAKVRHVACLANMRAGTAQDTYWAQVCREQRRRMLRVGTDESEIDRQLRKFRDAVADEIRRISKFPADRGSGT